MVQSGIIREVCEMSACTFLKARVVYDKHKEVGQIREPVELVSSHCLHIRTNTYSYSIPGIIKDETLAHKVPLENTTKHDSATAVVLHVRTFYVLQGRFKGGNPVTSETDHFFYFL